MTLPALFRARATRWFGIALGVLFAALAAWRWRNSEQQLSADGEAIVDEVVASEELLLTLTPEMGRISQGLLNLELPDALVLDRFDEQVRYTDLAPAEAGQLDHDLPELGVSTWKWEVDPEVRSGDRAVVAMWRPLLERIDYFEHAKFYLVQGDFIADDRTRWGAEVGFAALAATRDRRWLGIKATLDVKWRKTGQLNSSGIDWRITDWRLLNLKSYESPGPLFVDVLAEVLPDPAARAEAERSVNEEWRLKVNANPDFKEPFKYFVEASNYECGVSVVDLNGDGLDDLFIVPRWGKSMLLRSRGDGTYEEVAGELGLQFEDFYSCGLFADFDNDGDSDLFLGGTLRPSLYLENVDGRFVDRSRERVSVPLPQLVHSISATDFNGDGLLDVYFSTYAAYITQRQLLEARGQPMETLLGEFLGDDEARELARRANAAHPILDRPGPPNLLLVNRGGSFDRSPASNQLAVWKNTFQATWSDYDNDGDPDVYVANDFSPNNLFRNDGDGQFVDVTAETGTADIGFGMGVAWGDYDRDGLQDLYVSNMYSKAGRRITKRIPGVDPRFADMARGNSLFRNLREDFQKVSGMEQPLLLVENGGWSWGSQFADFNNDGWLDLVALSGNHTAPQDVAVQVDL